MEGVRRSRFALLTSLMLLLGAAGCGGSDEKIDKEDIPKPYLEMTDEELEQEIESLEAIRESQTAQGLIPSRTLMQEQEETIKKLKAAMKHNKESD